MIGSLRLPTRAARIACLLWLAFAIVVWNVVFDRVLVLAGREYVYAASTAAQTAGSYVRASDWMREAVARGALIASGSAVAILVVGLGLVPLATKRRGTQP